MNGIAPFLRTPARLQPIYTQPYRKKVHRFDVVVTSGGVGATHDDITIKV